MTEIIRPYEGNDPYIFVTYARKDTDTVLPFLEAMDKAGYRIWYDEGIPWTEEWPNIIAEHLSKCAVCIAFHSIASRDSRHCKAELHYAMSNRKHILSFYLEDDVHLPPGLEMYLAVYQAVKLSHYPSPKDFCERLNSEKIFNPCRRDDVVWHKAGEVQWYLNAEGVLSISKNLDYRHGTGRMPDYSYDCRNKVAATAPWMLSRENITSVVIEDGVQRIGGCAFCGCINLVNVEIADSVLSVGQQAFSYCTALKKISIPNSVINIGTAAFQDCANLTDVNLPDTLTQIEDGMFYGCENIADISIPETVSSTSLVRDQVASVPHVPSAMIGFSSH